MRHRKKRATRTKLTLPHPLTIGPGRVDVVVYEKTKTGTKYAKNQATSGRKQRRARKAARRAKKQATK